jgi:hypothetical protein
LTFSAVIDRLSGTAVSAKSSPDQPEVGGLIAAVHPSTGVHSQQLMKRGRAAFLEQGRQHHVGPVPLGEMRPIGLAQRANLCTAMFFVDLPGLIAVSAIEALRTWFHLHSSAYDTTKSPHRSISNDRQGLVHRASIPVLRHANIFDEDEFVQLPLGPMSAAPKLDSAAT